MFLVPEIFILDVGGIQQQSNNLYKPNVASYKHSKHDNVSKNTHITAYTHKI